MSRRQRRDSSQPKFFRLRQDRNRIAQMGGRVAEFAEENERTAEHQPASFIIRHVVDCFAGQRRCGPRFRSAEFWQPLHDYLRPLRGVALQSINGQSNLSMKPWRGIRAEKAIRFNVASTPFRRERNYRLSQRLFI
ncbi:MAG: hypothetical protein WDM81_14830 [Rhizomicrobium sp.]